MNQGMDTRWYKVGDIVKFHGDTPEECDHGEVVEFSGPTDVMKVRWEKAREIYDEDPADDRISLISRGA